MKNFNILKKALLLIQNLDKYVIWLTLAISAIKSAVQYAGVILLGYIITNIALGASMNSLIQVSLIVLSVALVLGFIREYLAKKEDIHRSLCGKEYSMMMSKRSLDMDYEILDSPFINNLKDQIRKDNNWGAGIYSLLWAFPQFFNSTIGIITSLAIIFPMFMIEQTRYPLMGLLVVILVLNVIRVYFYNSLQEKFHQLVSTVEDHVRYYGYFVQNSKDYKNGKDIRLYNIEPLIQSKIENDLSRRLLMKEAPKNRGLNGLVEGITTGVFQVISYIFVVTQAINGVISAGDAVKYAMTITLFSNAISNFFISYSALVLAARRQITTIEYANTQDILHKGTLPVEKRDDFEYEVEFHNVSFKYPRTDIYVLKDLNIKFTIGEKLAIVGMNGSGKSTMIKLLCRLYDPTDGYITLNGIDIKKYDYEEYNRVFSVVFQDFNLFGFSLAENVASSNPVCHDKIDNCLTEVGFDRKSLSNNHHLSKGYDPEGIDVSGGEAQKIALARALYKNAPFIILDEPTAALDPISEFEIYSKFDTLVGNKTAIYISHRLSSCIFCDKIAVFDQGQLVQTGSHDELLHANGKYTELWNAQAKHYQEA